MSCHLKKSHLNLVINGKAPVISISKIMAKKWKKGAGITAVAVIVEQYIVSSLVNLRMSPVQKTGWEVTGTLERTQLNC